MKQSRSAAAGAVVFRRHGLGEGRGELRPVHGVHGRGVLHHGLGLVALQLADEVPAQAEVLQAAPPFRGLLVPVFPDVGDAQRRQPPDVLRRDGIW